MSTIQLNIESATELYKHWMSIKGQYRNPEFICDSETLYILRTFHDNAHRYFWEPDFINIYETLFKVPLCHSEKIKGLYVSDTHGYFWVQLAKEGNWYIASYSPSQHGWFLSYEFSSPNEGYYPDKNIDKIFCKIIGPIKPPT